jgi:hypothetical protein
MSLPLLRCDGQAGNPAEPQAMSVLAVDATTADVEAAAPAPPIVAIAGDVRTEGAAGNISGAVVIAEVGGLDRPNPAALGDGGTVVATVEIDPFIRYGDITNGAGVFAFPVPAGAIGLHALASGYIGQDQLMQTGPSADAAGPGVLFSLVAHAQADGGALAPAVTGLTASPTVAGPLAPITFAVRVTAGTADDPVSSDVFLVEPITHWAGALAPPLPAVPGGPYPDGVYNRIVEAPSAPGVYRYTVIAASMARVASVPAAVVVTITETGSPPLPDAGFGPDGSFFVDGGGLPDGRH